MARGLIIGGGFGALVARQKSGTEFELGELLVAEAAEGKHLLQVFDVVFASQISPQHLEYISGVKLEEGSSLEFMDPQLRNYTLGKLRSLVRIDGSKSKSSKSLPQFFGELREVTGEDLHFLTRPANPLFVGNLRSGSRVLDVPVYLKGQDAIAHHILIPATTGRGKSNLLKCLLWRLASEDYAGALVLDPHDEYYNAEPGLKDHPRRDKIIYYSRDPTPGARTLTLNLTDVRPEHFQGAADWSTPQLEAISAYWKKYNTAWVEAIVLEKPLEGKFYESTLAVVRRRVMDLLSLAWDGQQLHCEGAFQLNAGAATITDICAAIMHGKLVVVDTSSFDGHEEILVGSMVATELFRRYKQAKLNGTSKDLPVASIVLEEAPRVLGKEVLEKGPNIFNTIAREGRKFKVGLLAITQLPSLIPRQVLANMNTKIILGIEMKPERQAIIESAAQDLSEDDRAIAALDKGEAIVTSNFAPFALPVKVPLFEDLVKAEKNTHAPTKKSYPGLG